MTASEECRARYELYGPMRWEDIDLVRKGIECFARVVLRDEGRTHAVSMVVGELLENAIKHGSVGGPVELVVQLEAPEHYVRVRSRMGEDPAAYDTLREMIDWIGTFERPLEAYQARIREVVRLGSNGGLGLVRIAHEGHCALDYHLDQAHHAVDVVARFL